MSHSTTLMSRAFNSQSQILANRESVNDGTEEIDKIINVIYEHQMSKTALELQGLIGRGHQKLGCRDVFNGRRGEVEKYQRKNQRNR